MTIILCGITMAENLSEVMLVTWLALFVSSLAHVISGRSLMDTFGNSNVLHAVAEEQQ